MLLINCLLILNAEIRNTRDQYFMIYFLERIDIFLAIKFHRISYCCANCVRVCTQVCNLGNEWIDTNEMN